MALGVRLFKVAQNLRRLTSNAIYKKEGVTGRHHKPEIITKPDIIIKPEIIMTPEIIRSFLAVTAYFPLVLSKLQTHAMNVP